jgi:multidrug transporter EmrE-like cation transporter
MAWLLLTVAIVVEVVATVALKLSDGFTRWLWTAVVIGGYGLSLGLLAQVVRTIPLAVTYAVWAGVGTGLTALASLALFNESMTSLKVVGFVLIAGGVALLNVHAPH